MKLAGPADNFKHHRLERLILGGNIYSDTMHHLRQAYMVRINFVMYRAGFIGDVMAIG